MIAHNWPHVATMRESGDTASSQWKPLLLNGSSTERAQRGPWALARIPVPDNPGSFWPAVAF